MHAVGVRDSRSYDRRGRHRVGLSAPAQFCRGIVGDVESESSATGQTANLSTGGLYLTTSEDGPFAPGDVVTVSITIPPDSRRLFPFSRIVGACSVVRAEELPREDARQRWGLALEFCRGRTTMLGAIVTT